MRLPRNNIIMKLKDAHEGVVHMLLYLGNKAVLPSDFVSRYCAESRGERFCRMLLGCMGGGFYHFRMKVARFGESAEGVFAWRLEEAFCVLSKLGFMLYDDNRGEWTPYGIFRYLVEQRRAAGPMPVLRECPGKYVEDMIC